MSWKMTTRLVNASGITSDQFRVLAVFADAANLADGEAWPGLRRVAETAELSLTTVHRATVGLRQRRYLVDTGRRVRRAIVYRVNLPVEPRLRLVRGARGAETADRSA